ncbi:BnaC07g06700D [Brassica napus]|uniref:BnaC07g06700D protein n=2 Tax=Brassica napus TaxID=3708 RepID=A0A078G5S5_BRANA|nr:BnaC07g06700D [Brassica napus]
MGFVYGTGMMREKSKSKFFLHHNFAAEGLSRGFSDIGVSSAERQCCGYVQDWTVLLLWSARFSKAVEKGEPRSMELILFPHLNTINIVTVGRLLCLWDSHNIKKNDEYMGISLLLLYEQQQLDLPSVSSLTPLWCCSGGLSRVDTMEGRKKKSSYQLENFTRSLPTPVNR